MNYQFIDIQIFPQRSFRLGQGQDGQYQEEDGEAGQRDRRGRGQDSPLRRAQGKPIREEAQGQPIRRITRLSSQKEDLMVNQLEKTSRLTN